MDTRGMLWLVACCPAPAGSGLRSGLVLGCQVQEGQPALLTSCPSRAARDSCLSTSESVREDLVSLTPAHFSKHCFACVNLLIRDK